MEEEELRIYHARINSLMNREVITRFHLTKQLDSRTQMWQGEMQVDALTSRFCNSYCCWADYKASPLQLELSLMRFARGFLLATEEAAFGKEEANYDGIVNLDDELTDRTSNSVSSDGEEGYG